MLPRWPSACSPSPPKLPEPLLKLALPVESGMQVLFSPSALLQLLPQRLNLRHDLLHGRHHGSSGNSGSAYATPGRDNREFSSRRLNSEVCTKSCRCCPKWPKYLCNLRILNNLLTNRYHNLTTLSPRVSMGIQRFCIYWSLTERSATMIRKLQHSYFTWAKTRYIHLMVYEGTCPESTLHNIT